MTRAILSRIIITFFIAFAVSAILAPLATAAVEGLLTHNICSFGTSPIMISSSLDPASSTSSIQCIDKSGNLHTIDQMLFYNWLVFFVPIDILLFIVFYRTQWIRKLSKSV
jgi:hypothetical protein